MAQFIKPQDALSMFDKSLRALKKLKYQAVFTDTLVKLLKASGKVPAAVCGHILSVVEKLGGDAKLKLGDDLATFAALCLSADRQGLAVRVSAVCAGIAAQQNELVKLMLSKENVGLVVELPSLLA